MASSSATKRVLLAGLFHETHTFLEGKTTLADFTTLRNKELLQASGDASPLAGALDAARQCNWELAPLIDYHAMPGPMLDRRVVDQFWQEFHQRVEPEWNRGIDGIFLVLHGSMVADDLDDVEGFILRQIRSLPGAHNIPIGGVLDLHANVSPLMAELSQGLVAYQENPHTDAKQTAQRAGCLLNQIMQANRHPVTLWEQPPVIWPPTGTGTADAPMRLLESHARRLEKEVPGILAVNVFAGFSFADTPNTGVSFTAIVAGDPEPAREGLRDLSERALQHKAEGTPIASDADSDTVMRTLQTRKEGPILLVEPADNIGGGAPGDGTALLRAFLDYRIPNAGIILNDPESVQALDKTAPGQTQRLALGGKGSRLDPGPVTLEVELISTSDGQFELQDPNSHLASMSGRRIDMGPCAVVRHGEITILLTSRKTPPFDLGQWTSQGIDPARFFAIVVKAAVAHRRAYDPIARESFYVDTPGPCTANLKSLPFRRVRRPVYPLDSV